MKRILSALCVILLLLSITSAAPFAYADEAVSQITTTETTTKKAAELNSPSVSGYCDLTSNPVIKWKKVTGAKKYIIYRAEKKNGKYKKIGESSKLTFTDKKTKLHKTYYYKVKAYRKKGSKAITSDASSAVKLKAMKTVFVGDSVMHAVYEYKVFPQGHFVSRIGVGTYSFYNVNLFKSGGKSVTGIDKLIASKPDRVFIMLGMNEMHYQSDSSILQYYRYIIEDLKESRKGVEVVLLSVSPTNKNSGKTYPKKKRIDGFNKKLKKLAKKTGCSYYDFTAPFKDSTGNLSKKCDGGDGCHWNVASCRLFIEQIKKYVKSN